MSGRAGAGQGGQTFSITGRYLLAAPIRNRAGQGRAIIFIIEHIKKIRIFLKKKKENK
jgi:hypothetical protein